MVSEDLRPAWAEVNLDNLLHNFSEVRRLVGKDVKILAAVKADAYGHGAVPCSKALVEAGADMFGVAMVTEGVELRNAGITNPILNLGYTPREQYGLLLKYNLSAAVYNSAHAQVLNSLAAKKSTKAHIHVKIDTGMGRLGFQANDQTIREIKSINALPYLKIDGVFTHFAASDMKDKSYTRKQFELFQWILGKLRDNDVEIPIKHVSNSAAIIDLPEYNLDMVRPGGMLYGYMPSEGRSDRVNLKPCMSLKARFSNVKTVAEGTALSYGLTFVTNRRSVIGTVPLGYADGYRRALSNCGIVGIDGKSVPVVGRVCMDQFMVDLTNLDVDLINVDEVTIFGGYGSPTVEELAKQLCTIPDEIICDIARRVPRVYLRDGKIVEVKDHLLTNSNKDAY